MKSKSEQAVEFMVIAEAGILESQALLLCESIRHFCGRYANCPITVVSPRSSRRPSPETLRKLDMLSAEYLPTDVRSAAPDYGTSYRVHAAACIESRPGPPVIVQLDSDTAFISEPDFSLLGVDAAARPVDVKGMCTTGPDDAFDAYWRKLCAILSVDYEGIPWVETTVDRQVVRASYNGGLLVTRRASGLFARTDQFFRRLVEAELHPWTANGPLLRTGTGFLSGSRTAYWGTSQAAFSLAAVASGRDVQLLPATHNFPLHSIDQMTAAVRDQLVHLHYHWLFTTPEETAPILKRLNLPSETADWLEERLPLHS